MSLAGSSVTLNRLSAQPQPGALFSASATAQLSLGLPTPNTQAAAAGLLGGFGATVSGASSVSTISGLESTLSLFSPTAPLWGASAFTLPLN